MLAGSPNSTTRSTVDVATDERAPTVVPRRSRLERVMRIEWLGQTAASLCWIGSVFSYGISYPGDWLQLCAGSAWFLANIAAITTAEGD
ncbi:MAG: hypothetical protein OXU33_02360 [Gemmatimonadota bacterium]|nr:hypothetical protein [Gemmatimonadota bacterium]MDE3006745.1 hypothetical protein [Gemmatimonadota bacterium]MDE3012889.1 hypothetical protein [Gemmatimonadota bacterium]